jgi:AcrR family transcriptional regulator
MMATSTAARRRRNPEEARAEILTALGDLLREGPSEEVTVAAVMARTTLSRKSFYVYFRDRADAITALVTPLRADADAALDEWRAADDVVTAGRQALRRAARTYRDHGALLRALATASDRDSEAASVWAGFIDPLVGIATRLVTDARTGLAPEPTARALVTMNVHTLLTLRPDTPDDDLASLVDALSAIWERTILSPPTVPVADRRDP